MRRMLVLILALAVLLPTSAHAMNWGLGANLGLQAFTTSDTEDFSVISWPSSDLVPGLRVNFAGDGGGLALYGRMMVFVASVGSASLEEEPADPVGRALDFVRENYRASIKLSALAGSCGLGPSRFSQLFRARTGCSPGAYVNSYRLRQAEALLLHSDHPVTAIAAYLGFTSIHYFSRAFSRHAGCSPTAFRSSHSPPPASG